VLCYGQLSVSKGALTLFDAWRTVQAEQPEAYLVVVDSSSATPDPAVMAALDRMDPSSVRRFPIATDVVPFLHACDVVAFPTLLPETFGRVVLEGMATGRPVVASRVGAVPELLTGPMSRFLVEPGSAEHLADTLVDVLDWWSSEPDLLDACTRWVEDHFPFRSHVDQLESALADHRRPARVR
jgi:glycosyltransferase involved in cell wall biosynthesis